MNLELRIMKIVVLSFLILHSSFFIPKAYAEAMSLAVDPPIFQINATPPAKITSPLVVENRGDSTLSLKVSFKPFTPSERYDGLIKYVKEELELDVKVTDEKGQETSEFEISPNQKKNLNLLINIPEQSVQKDYYFSIIFLGSNKLPSENSTSMTAAGVASNVLLSVGSGKVSGEISEFSAPVFLEKGPTPFTVIIKNTSNHFITPKGEILIKNIFGQTIGRVDLAQVNILANSARIIPSQDFFNEENPSENLAAYWPQSFILGPYKASLSIALSDTGPLFKRSILFFAFPLKALAGVSFGTIVLIYIAVKVKSKT